MDHQSDLLDQVAGAAQQMTDVPPQRDAFSAVAAVLQGVQIARLAAAALSAAVHPTAGLARHRGRTTRYPASGPGTAAEALVHGQAAVHELVPLFGSAPHPPGWCRQ